MVRIYGRVTSLNVQKVMWTVGELAIPHEQEDVGGAFGGLDTDAYAAMNPNRKIPVVVDGHTIVWESNACVRYLAAKFGEGSLWPVEPADRARSDMWMDWVLANVLPDLNPLFIGLVRTPADKRDNASLSAHAQRLGPVFGILDRHLAGTTFVAGDTLTIGDITTGATAYRYLELPIARPDLPNLRRWSDQLRTREAYRQHVAMPLT